MVQEKIPTAKSNSDFTCGPAALKIILDDCGKHPSDDEILHSLNIKSGQNTDMPSIAMALKQFGVDFTFFLFMPDFVGDDCITISIVFKLKDLLANLESPKQKEFIRKILNLLENHSVGIDLIFKRFTRLDIQTALGQGFSMITVVDSQKFSDGEVPGGQHIIVLNGMDQKDFIFVSSKRFSKPVPLALDSMYSAKVPSLLVVKNVSKF